MEAKAVRSGPDIRAIVNRVGMPTLIISGFLIIVLIAGVVNGIPLNTMLTDSIFRFGRYGILTLAMVPSIQSGTGPNFALPIGIVGGLLAEVIAIELGLTGPVWLAASFGLAILIGAVFGFAYGHLMNAVKGSEMTIATYTGFSVTMLFCLIWLILPFNNPNMRWLLGSGLRQTIQLDAVGGQQILDKLLQFEIAGIKVPTGMFIIFAIACFIVWLFQRSKAGHAIAAGGMNPMFASAAGLNVNRGRVTANMLSTILSAVGIIVFAQSFGYTQLYTAPLLEAFPAVAGILIGGATVSRAKVSNAILGAFLFQTLMTTATPVTNAILAGAENSGQISDSLRSIIQNGIILYALMQARGGGRK